MSQIYFDVDKRNLELIMTLMEIVGVADCEELPNKVNELKRAAELSRAPVQSELNGAVFCRPQFHLFIDGVCAHCGYDERPVQNRSDGG